MGKYKIEVFDTRINDYRATTVDMGLVIDVEEVFDDDHKVVHQKGQQGTGEFTFTAIDSGEHRICFNPQSYGWISKIKTKVNIDFTIGEAKVFDSKNKDAIGTLTSRVKVLTNKVNEIRREQKLMRDREALFRDQSESTNYRVVKWSMIQSLVLTGTCIWQMRHLRTFFVKQKLV
ncbi:emp24/gp25L/p24 family protein ASCRUDRAFT_75253 [Ascoidea rubescens DSM 1968]|uniref:GOLD domain-containing protein n=1 Tax=Ascoidea rubescens DSM 1968 TaxID=1344418 RepID=A0A1D2VK86_9ASCO|nr:hypothetical protein ASCRUDRAFT_75253 [Ascoidea rubescens DSM 1968]ODV62031.1 hypothetical protein ASCRUDRAFT_75253 [Ascoidea rubescens DSM 1968]